MGDLKLHFTPFYLLSNLRRMTGRTLALQPNWRLASELFAVGHTTACRLCREAGIDPDGLDCALRLAQLGVPEHFEADYDGVDAKKAQSDARAAVKALKAYAKQTKVIDRAAIASSSGENDRG